jgi:hypothetical protein
MVLLFNQGNLQESFYSPPKIEISPYSTHRIGTTVQIYDADVTTPIITIIGDIRQDTGLPFNDCLTNLTMTWPEGYILIKRNGKLEWRKK